MKTTNRITVIYQLDDVEYIHLTLDDNEQPYKCIERNGINQFSVLYIFKGHCKLLHEM